MQDSDVFFLTNGNKTLTGVDEMNCPAELNIPFGVTKIDKRSLADCPAKKVFIPDTVTEICYEAFDGCDALEYVRMPKKLETLGPAIFRGCLSLEKVEMGDTCPNFSEGMFELCPSLKEAPFRRGMTEVSRNAFSECLSLESLVFPEGVAVIKSGAAAYCQNLSTVVLPSTIRIIEDDAFRNCPSLAHIRINGENPVFFVDEDTGCLFENREDGDLTLIKVPVNATEIRIPKKVSHCHSEAFQGCDALERVFIDCDVVDHPLFVALKTEIVNAEILNENDIPKQKPKAKKAAKPKTAKKEKTEKKPAAKKTTKTKEKPTEEKKAAKPKKSTTAKKPRALGVAEAIEHEEPVTEFEIEEPVCPEPSEPNTDALVVETQEETQISQNDVEKIAASLVGPSEPAEEAAIEEPVFEEIAIDEPAEESAAFEIEEDSAEENENFDAFMQEPEVADPLEGEIEETAVNEDEVVVEEETDAADSEADMIADILGQNIAANETPEEEEEELKGITISIDELDEAMLRGVQDDDDRHYEIPEGFFPESKQEEEPVDMPPPEPRFVNGLMSVSATYEIIDERALYPDRAESELNTAAPNELEDITTLVVVTEEVTEENTISESLKNFCVDLAQKHNLVRVYIFGAVGLDNDELLYGFGKFALYRNVIYATKSADIDSLSAEVKSFAEIAELDTNEIHSISESLELEKPFKIFVTETEKPQPESKPLSGKGLLQKAQQALDRL